MDNDTRATRDAATLIALVCLIAWSVAFVAFAALVMPQLLGVFLVVGLFLGAVALHYLVWGWWLSAALKMEELETRESASSADTTGRGSVGGPE